MRANRLLLHLGLLMAMTLAGYELMAWKASAQYRPVLDLRSVQSFWRVSARSALQAPLGEFSQTQLIDGATQAVSQTPAQPRPASHYPVNSPATQYPFLLWTKVEGAVYYEWEIWNAPPNAKGVTPINNLLFSTREVYANGYHANLGQFSVNPLYWRVRALDYDGNPIGAFSQPERIFIHRDKIEQIKPEPTALYDAMPPPLYPVYYWIPVNGAASYEVEITNNPPENPGGVTPSVHRIDSKSATGYGCYDDVARSHPGTYYWRVRALDSAGQALGVYSDAVPFVIDREQGRLAATFGDSITHGGGAVSYSPADPEYSYQTYLDFPVANLGHSGDTTSMMVKRFESDVLPYQPRNLLIMGGTNSLRGGVRAQQAIDDLQAIQQKCLRYGIRPIFLTLPPINPAAIKRVFQEETSPHWRKEFDLVNAFIRQQRYYIDIEPYFLDANRELPEKFAIDGLHLDIEGKKLMARVINHYWASVSQ